MSLERTRLIAKGDITPSRFVKLDATAGVDFGVLQAAAATDRIFGVSQVGSRKFPSSTGSADDALAAKNNETLEIFQDGNECPLEIGAAVVPGDYLKSDASGRGIPMTFSENVATFYGAVALEHGAAAGVKIRVQVRCGVFDSGA